MSGTDWGITFVSAGTLDAARLMLAVYQFDGIVWGARQIVDMFPAIASMMQVGGIRSPATAALCTQSIPTTAAGEQKG